MFKFSVQEGRFSFNVLQFCFGKQVPDSTASAGEEELDSRKGNSKCSVRTLLFDFQMQ